MNRLEEAILKFQQEEINQHEVYSRISRKAKGSNRRVLKSISKDELEHYYFWKKHSQKELEPERVYTLKYDLLSFIFGFIFTIKLIEANEKRAQREYA